MRVRNVYTLKACATLEEALAYAKKINNGAGKHADRELEIEYDKKAKKIASLGPPKGIVAAMGRGGAPPSEEEDEEGLQWKVVVVNDGPIPGGSPCAECEQPHFEDDYLCPDCRAAT